MGIHSDKTPTAECHRATCPACCCIPFSLRLIFLAICNGCSCWRYNQILAGICCAQQGVWKRTSGHWPRRKSVCELCLKRSHAADCITNWASNPPLPTKGVDMLAQSPRIQQLKQRPVIRRFNVCVGVQFHPRPLKNVSCTRRERRLSRA